MQEYYLNSYQCPLSGMWLLRSINIFFKIFGVVLVILEAYLISTRQRDVALSILTLYSGVYSIAVSIGGILASSKKSKVLYLVVSTRPFSLTFV